MPSKGGTRSPAQASRCWFRWAAVVAILPDNCHRPVVSVLLSICCCCACDCCLSLSTECYFCPLYCLLYQYFLTTHLPHAPECHICFALVATFAWFLKCCKFLHLVLWLCWLSISLGVWPLWDLCETMTAISKPSLLGESASPWN